MKSFRELNEEIDAAHRAEEIAAKDRRIAELEAALRGLLEKAQDARAILHDECFTATANEVSYSIEAARRVLEGEK